MSGSGETSSAQDIEMDDYRPAVRTDYRPVVRTRPEPKRKRHARGIIYQRLKVSSKEEFGFDNFHPGSSEC